MTVAAVVATIPGREQLLDRAYASIAAQTRPPDVVRVMLDRERRGAAWARNQAIATADTDWIAVLDDDDEWLPWHLATLLDCAEATGADVVYPHWVADGTPPALPLTCGDPFDGDLLRRANYIPATILARSSLVRQVGGYPDGDVEDWRLLVALLDAGARFVHLPLRTWVWHFHDGHTRGQP